MGSGNVATPEDSPSEDTWHGPGPVLDEAIRARLATLLDRPPSQITYAGALQAIEDAWTTHAPSPPTVRALRQAEQDLHRLQQARDAAALRALAVVTAALERGPCSVAELTALVPKLITDLGFSRGLISRVEGDTWIPELMYVAGDPQSSQELTRVGQARPQRLEVGMHETEAAHARRAVLATDVHLEPWRSHAELAGASRTRSYVVAPLVSRDAVVGLLHGERYGQRRDVDETDRLVIEAFAQAVHLALSRAAVATGLSEVQQNAAALTRAAASAAGSVHALPPLRVDRAPGTAPDGLVIRTGPGLALPAELTRREREVLELMAAGKPNHAIAHELVIAESTVKQHVKHILRKLLVGSRAEAVARWFQAGSPGATEKTPPAG